jgi:hypothetical protein
VLRDGVPFALCMYQAPRNTLLGKNLSEHN